MKFYDQLASTYDYFIDWDKRIKNEDPFLQHLFRESLGNSVLDLGCGNGAYANYLAELGFNIVGIDSSREMIEAAKQKAVELDVDAEFQNLHLTSFAQSINVTFDNIISLGNTLAHVLEESQMLQMFQECIQCLKPSGTAIFHTLNYGRILENKRRDFPVKHYASDGQEHLFLRFYNFDMPFLDFNMVVASREGDAWTSRSMQLKHKPWMKGDLQRLARKAGFTNIMHYGGFDFSDFDPDESENLIMVCELGDEELEPFKVKAKARGK